MCLNRSKFGTDPSNFGRQSSLMLSNGFKFGTVSVKPWNAVNASFKDSFLKKTAFQDLSNCSTFETLNVMLKKTAFQEFEKLFKIDISNQPLKVPKVSEHFEFSDHFSMGSNDGGRYARLRKKGIKNPSNR
ncbi:hypothetical protein OUZ56_009586 [Daphnia magna]|uniref:Uncharacterized protein n=1 Tax=Daphnia magna TaxID=35525 RepID=A0ABR0AGF7_9CRUS|nr:hypothetical protein OUZ56_009586 [Daphnia magna]